MLGLANRMSLSLGGANNGGGVAIASRYFTELSSAGNKHFEDINQVFTGDFTFKGKCINNGSGSSFEAIMGSDDSTDQVVFTNAGVMRFRADTTTLDFAIGEWPTNKTFSWELSRVGSLLTATADGLSKSNASANTGTVNIDTFGRLGGANYYNGIIYNIELFDGSDRVGYYKIDETWANGSTVLVDYATTLGSEEITNGDFSANVDDWTEVSSTKSFDDGTCEVVTAAAGGIRQSFTTVIGETYFVTYTTTSSDVDNQVKIGNGVSGDIYTGPLSAVPVSRVAVFAAEQTTTTIYLRNNAAGTVNWDNISVKAASGYGTAVNITDADADQFTKSGADWLGVTEFVTNGGFDSDTGWSKGVGWAISGGTAEYSGPNGTSFIHQEVLTWVDGQSFRFFIDVLVNSGATKNSIYFGLLNEVSMINLPVGSHVLDGIKGGSNDRLYIQANNNETFEIDNVSMKQLLEGA